jgi:hypothetical protein
MTTGTIKPKLKDFKLDAYGHLSYVVGFNSDYDEEATPAMLLIAKASEMSDEEIEAAQQGLRDCGDWIACTDFDRIGDYVGWHVVVNSDSGGFIDTLDSGVYTVEEARKHLPGLLETWNDTASEHLVEAGHWFTPAETQEYRAAIKRWKADLAEALK